MESPVLRRAIEVNTEALVEILRNNDLNEFVEFVRERRVDGRTFLEINAADLRLWNPNCDTEKISKFIKEFKYNPHKYSDKERTIEVVNVTIESQYQTVNMSRKIKERNKSIDEIMKNLVPAKSFLYKYQKPIKLTTSYVPMEASPKKPKKFFRLSSYDYPFSDLRSRFSRQENFNDRGYYFIKTNKSNQDKTKADIKTKYKSMPNTDEFKDDISEDHHYEDLCYTDVEKEQDRNSNAIKTLRMPQVNVRPCVNKIQEIFSTLKIPFFKKEDVKETEAKNEKVKEIQQVKDERKVEQYVEVERDSGHLYENNDSVGEVMYDYPMKHARAVTSTPSEVTLSVEDYLEPIPIEREYCDVGHQEESLLSYIMNIFENFGIRKDTSDIANTEDCEIENKQETKHAEEKQKKPADRKLRTSMADRPLPVPVENETYYMNISRVEAENMLTGQPDGTFILRPTTQPNHAYTLTVACGNAVHNVGVRRRADGRLALGYARKGERSFTSIASLLRHHRKQRLLLVASGGVLGATTLNESPEYYQAPKSLPVAVLQEK